MKLHQSVTNSRALQAFKTLELRFNEKHNFSYSYEKSVYKNNITKIKIFCNKHKTTFLQTPTSHLSGAGCPICAKEENGVSFEDFVSRAILKHGKKFRYKKTKFINMHTKTEIVCKKHGVFLQEPTAHLMGLECTICAKERNEVSFEEFEKRGLEKHGHKYQYDKSKFVNMSIKTEITCQQHGIFLQTPSSHLSGAGCPMCAGRAKKTTSSFIADAKIIHGNLYDYSKVEYKNAISKVEIICKVHGSFFQVARAHTDGSGCPQCNKGGRKKLI